MRCDSPFYVLPKAGTEKVPVPCGRCPPCKLRRVNSWVFRLKQELKVSSSAHFVTLTYDTRYVPITPNGFMTLRKKDLQDYFKRLRKLCDAKGCRIKYYAVGEYGTKNNRPHYHLIIFNVPDIRFYADAWHKGSDPLGSVHIGQVTDDSCAYTMKYIDKPSKKRLHYRDDREKEFPVMSKRLGVNYLSPDIVEYHRADLSRLYCTKEGGHKVALPRYYRNKIYSESELKKQIEIISKNVDIQERQLRLEFEALGYPESYAYEDWKVSKAYGRYSKFYSNQKNRDI